MFTKSAFIEQLTSTVESLNVDTVKSTIGDSTDNHRSLSVSQLIRYLNTRRNVNNRRLAAVTQEVYASVRNAIYAERASFGLSTEYTVYVGEFISFLENTDISAANSLRAAIKRAV